MRKLSVLALVVINFLPSFAQYEGRKIFDINECLDIASKKNPDILLSYTKIRASSAQITSAFGGYLPSINFNMGYNRQLTQEGPRKVYFQGFLFESQPQDPNAYNMSANATYDIFDGFSREAQFSRAQENYNSSYYSSLYTRKKVELDVHKQYIDIVRNAQFIRVRQDNLELGKKLLESIQAQHSAGVIPVGDVYAQESDNGNRELDLVKAENDYNISKSVLLTTMGLEASLEAEFSEASIKSEITPEDVTNFRSQVGSSGSAINEALKNRMDYTSTKASLKASESDVSSAKSGYFPKLTAQGGWSWSNSRFSDFSQYGRSFIGLNLSVPIFDNFNTNAQIQQADLQVKQTETQMIQLEQSIRSDVLNAFYNLDAAEKQIDITKRTLKSAELNFDSMKERYNVGSASITDLFMANNQLVTARINRITAIYNYIQAQKAALFAIGKL